MEIIKSCRAPVVDSATTNYETTMAHYKFYKKGGRGGGGHLYWLKNSKRGIKPRFTTAFLWSMIRFCYNHYPKGLFQILTTHTMMSSGTKKPARTVTRATMGVFLSWVGSSPPVWCPHHLPLLQTLGM